MSLRNRIKNYLYENRYAFILSLSFFILFWIFRSVRMDEGSGDLWYREVEKGVWFRKRRMLSFFLYQCTYQVMNSLFHWDGRWVINIVSCLAGAIFVFYLYKICRRWEKGWIPFILVMSSGMSTLFYGFIETYSMVIAATAIFFYTLLEYLDGKVNAIYPALMYSLAAGFHLEVGFLFPVIPLGWYFRGRKREEWKGWFLGLLPCFLLLFGIKFLDVGKGDFFENIQWIPFTTKPGISNSYTLFSKAHLTDFLWFQYRIAATTLPALLIISGFVNRKIWKEPFVQILAVATLAFLGLNFFHDTQRNLSVWTVFAIYGFPSTLMAGYLLTKIRFGKEIALVLTAISLFIMVPYILDHARLGHRGEGTIMVKNFPPKALLLLDGYYKKNPIYHVLEGQHELKIIQPPEKFTQQLLVIPYSTITIEFQGISPDAR